MAESLRDRVSELAENTPEDRNRYVDFIRVTAIGAVVVGHWLVIQVEPLEDPISGRTALVDVRWAHIITWGFQVIPLFFLVGGYANAISWRHHRDRGGDWASWLYRRTLRLLWPTTIFLAVGVAATLAASWVGMPEVVLDRAAWAAVFILWFLAAYVPIAALTPATLRLHDRWGLGSLALLALLVAGTELLRFTVTDIPSAANYALVWGAFHQAGYAWRDGALVEGKRPLVLFVVSAGLLVALVTIGPYPVSMVAVPGQPIQNTGPPTAALLAFGFAQAGLALMVRERLRPILHRRVPWQAVVAGNAVVMSVYLWHMYPVLALTGIMAWVGVGLPDPVGSPPWFLARPVWIVALAVLLALIVVAVSRLERPPDRLEKLQTRWSTSGLALAAGLIGVAGVSAGLAWIAIEGLWDAGSGTVAVRGLAAVAGGLGLLVIGAALSQQD